MSRPLLYDASGAPLRPAASLAYDNAGTGRRFASFYAPSFGPQSALNPSLDVLRDRSRALVRSNPWASSGLDSWVANLIGTGVVPMAASPDAAFNMAADEGWDEFAPEADPTGTTDVYGLQALAARCSFEAGETFARFRARFASDGLFVPLQVQLLEPDHVPTSYTRDLGGGRRIDAGVETSPIGGIDAFWVTPNHPGDPGRTATNEPVRVPAGDMAHVYYPRRIGQLRGEPGFARVILRAAGLDRYDDAELTRKELAAMFGGFIRSPLELAEEKFADDAEITRDGAVATVKLEPGTFPKLDPGEEVTISNPADVGPNFDAFVVHALRGIATGIGVTYEQLTADLSRVNYSSIRAGAIEFRRRLGVLLWSYFVHQFCRPLWRRYVEAAVFAGRLPVTAAEYLRNPRPWHRVVWIPQGFQYVDPAKEVLANVVAVRSGFKSRRAVIVEQGDDAMRVYADIAEDNRVADRLGLVFDSDPRRTNRAGGQQGDAAMAPPARGGDPLPLEELLDGEDDAAATGRRGRLTARLMRRRYGGM